MRSTLLTSIAAAALSLGALQAQAHDVKLDGFVYDSFFNPVTSVGISVNNPSPGGRDLNVSVEAGAMEGTLDGKSFTTFCLDVFQDIGFGSKYSGYQLADLTSTQSSSMGKLLTKYYDQVDDSKSSAAFQVALWEIMYDSGSNYDLKKGNFKGTDWAFLLGFGSDVETTAQSWLGNLGSQDDYDVSILKSANNQDLLWFSKTPVAPPVTPVPEPGTYALMLAGLGAIGWVARRRSV